MSTATTAAVLLDRPPPVFPAIDILRGFAALSVVIYHVIEHYKWTGFPTSGMLVWFRIGWIGVDLFLVISGFVISLSVHSLMEHLGYVQFLTTFARRRFSRIMPLYYSTCVIFVIFNKKARTHESPGFLTCAYYLIVSVFFVLRVTSL